MNLRAGKSLLLVFCLAVLAVCAVAVHAQSGRKQSKAPPAAPVPTPTPEPTPEPKQEKESDLGFIIGADQYSSYETFPLTYYDAAMRGCADGLRAGSSAKVTVATENMNRGEAIKKAKTEGTTTYIIQFKLVLDKMYAKSYDDFELEYVVFAPQTGKVVTTGRTYLNRNRSGPIVTSPTRRGPTSALYREQLLKQAGEDAAARILKAMNLSVPVLN
jgi:hypothetical protein